MKNQWSDTKKEKFADYIIENVSLDKMYKKAQEIFEKLKNNFSEKLRIFDLEFKKTIPISKSNLR